VPHRRSPQLERRQILYFGAALAAGKVTSACGSSASNDKSGGRDGGTGDGNGRDAASADASRHADAPSPGDVSVPDAGPGEAGGADAGDAGSYTFDYYISPTGSDSNPGSLASPWAITSLQDTSPNNSKMPSKQIGLLPGTYSVAALNSGSQPKDYAHPKLAIPSGTASAPTVVASTKPRAAVLDNTGYTGVNPVFGQNPDAIGYFVLDGVTIDDTGCAVTPVYCNYSGSRPYTGPGTIPGVVIQNCDVHGLTYTGAVDGENRSLIGLQGTLGAIVRNNHLHDEVDTAQPDHGHGYLEFGCTGTQLLQNTFSNCTSGSHMKAGSAGAVIAYNYYYNCSSSAIQGCDGAEGNPNTPDTAFEIHHNVIDTCVAPNAFDVNEGTAAGATMAIHWYANTIYDSYGGGAGSATALGLYTNTASKYDSLMSCYNNIVALPKVSSGYDETGIISTSKTGPAVWDYNDYYFASYKYAWGYYYVSGAQYSSLAAWQAAGGLDAHSLVLDPQFASTITPGAGAHQFKLASGSPCVNAGRVGGVSTGKAVNMGAWDGTATQIGCDFG
jgi:hypothetical protein